MHMVEKAVASQCGLCYEECAVGKKTSEIYVFSLSPPPLLSLSLFSRTRTMMESTTMSGLSRDGFLGAASGNGC